MKHFLIYTNKKKDQELLITKKIEVILNKLGQKSTIILNEVEISSKTVHDIEKNRIPEDAFCMLVLGGDGTILQAARDVSGKNIPLIGVNLGTLGYMTEIEISNLEEAMERLVNGDFASESRMMLQGTVDLQQGEPIVESALNDIVISRCGSLRIIKFSIYVNGSLLKSYNADGCIITTPTGSTGYNLSAGGPIVEPCANLIVLTPICPHTLNMRSIVLAPEDTIDIVITNEIEEAEQAVEASFDGAHVVYMKTGDKIRIQKSEKTTKFIQLNKVSFLEMLRNKLSD